MERRGRRFSFQGGIMADPNVLDHAFHLIMSQIVETGQAPHYWDLAGPLRCSVGEARQVVLDIMATGYPGTLYPGTDQIVWFPPLSSLPTQYRITVDGQQKWYAQCGFEALAVCWLFPRRVVHIDAPCLDCHSAVHLEMRDGQILRAQPDGIVGHLNRPWRLAPEDLPFT